MKASGIDGYVPCLTRVPARQCSQRGAVLVLALLVMGALVLAWQSRSSLTQTILAQQALDQASRAAALSAARWHARLMNAHAMLNRTEMAHQVAMAHLMTLASAWKFRKNMAASVTRSNPPAFLIGRFFGTAQARAYQSARFGMDARAMADIESAFKQHDHMLAHELRQARAELSWQISQRTVSLVKEVLRRNLGDGLWANPALDVQVINAHGLTRQVRPLKSDVRWQRWMDTVIRKQHYLKSRWNVRLALSPFYPSCPILKHLLIRTGSTEVRVNGYWSATDTESFHSVRPMPEWCYFREYPMGWSDQKVDAPPKSTAVDAVPERSPIRAPYRFKNFRKWVNRFGGLAWNLFFPLNNMLATYYGEDDRIVWRRESLPTPYHVVPEVRDVTITVKVSMRTAHLRRRSWRVRLDQDGLLEVPSSAWPTHLRSQAAAQVVYDRYQATARANRQQAEDLLQPFWVARHVPVLERL